MAYQMTGLLLVILHNLALIYKINLPVRSKATAFQIILKPVLRMYLVFCPQMAYMARIRAATSIRVNDSSSVLAIN